MPNAQHRLFNCEWKLLLLFYDGASKTLEKYWRISNEHRTFNIWFQAHWKWKHIGDGHAQLNILLTVSNKQNLVETPLVTMRWSSVLCHHLTHWGRVTHICVNKLTIIGSDNSLAPVRRQAIIWTNDGISLIGPLGTNFSEMLFKIHTDSSKKMHLKMSSGKRRLFCLGLNVLVNGSRTISRSMNENYQIAWNIEKIKWYTLTSIRKIFMIDLQHCPGTQLTISLKHVISCQSYPRLCCFNGLISACGYS